MKWECKQCGTVHRSNPDECKDCGNTILVQHRSSGPSWWVWALVLLLIVLGVAGVYWFELIP